MGQGQSQNQRASTPEPELSPEERAQAQAEMRAKQQAALDKRLAGQQRKENPATREGSEAQGSQGRKKESALQQMSRENVGWRELDAQGDVRRWD